MKELKSILKDFDEQPLPLSIVEEFLEEYKRPHDKISELVREGMLEPVKRGIYIPGKNAGIAKPEPFLLANHILGPSYVTVDSALAYWNFIPEKVYEITSATTLKTKTYNTPSGKFSYIHFPLPWYSYGIMQVKLTERQVALIASPEKALCDKIISTSGILLRSVKQVLQLLLEDLRMEKQALRDLNNVEIKSWLKSAPKKASLAMLVQTLEQI